MGCGASKKGDVAPPTAAKPAPPVTPDKPIKETPNNPPTNPSPKETPNNPATTVPPAPAEKPPPPPVPVQVPKPVPVPVPEQPQAEEEEEDVPVRKKVIQQTPVLGGKNCPLPPQPTIVTVPPPPIKQQPEAQGPPGDLEFASIKAPAQPPVSGEKELGAFSLPEVAPAFDEWAAAQLMASPDDVKDTDDFKYITFTEAPPFTAKHSSAMSSVVTADVFNSLKDKKTSKGFTLSNGIQVGVLRPAVTCGFTCGDEECYEVFKDVIVPIIKEVHGFEVGQQAHRSELDASQLNLTAEQSNKLSKYVKSTKISAVRNLSGFALPAGIRGKEERRAVEAAVREVLESFPSDWTVAGTYKGLGELTVEEEAELEAHELLFERPDAKSKVGASGGGREWPEGRGIFFNPGKTVACWVNEEDHCRLICRADFGHLQSVFGRFCELNKLFTAAVESQGKTLMQREELGYLAACPANVGSGMTASMRVVLPELTKDPFQLMALCEELGLHARSGAGAASVRGVVKWEIWNRQSVGCSEVQIVQRLLDGVVRLIDIELQLSAAGQDHEGGKQLGNFVLPAVTPVFDAWLRAQLLASPEDVKDTENFKYLRFAELPPFTAKHSSLMRTVLNPSVFEKLKSLRGTRTSKGFTLSNAIQPGVLQPRLDVGFVCGDEECYALFPDVILPLVRQLHQFDAAKDAHPRAPLDAAQLRVSDEEARKLQQCVKSTRIRGVRNIAGLALPPGTTREERAETEGVLKKVFGTFAGELAGKYTELGALGKEEVRALQDRGVLFQSPGLLQVLEGAGGYRDWPENRGLFVNESESAVCWCNEEDHCKVIAMEQGCDVVSVFRRYSELSAAVKAGLEQEGRALMETEALGFLATCPSNVGTGMKVSFKLELPAMTYDPERLDKTCRFLGLVLHGSGGKVSAAQNNCWEISNMQRVGLTEVEIVHKVVEGALRIIAMEQEEAAAIKEYQDSLAAEKSAE